MPDLKSIPDDTKWQISARCAATLPALFDAAIRPVAGGKCDELGQQVGIALADLTFDIARALRFPVTNAKEIGTCLQTINAVLFGPEFKGEVIAVGDDGAVVIVRRCPHLVQAGACGSREGKFHRCMAFNLASQKRLNPEYASRFVRAMCMGDRQCEMKIEPDGRKEQITSGRETG